EALTIDVVEALSNKRMIKPFPRFSYDETMSRFGSDKPDVRYALELVDCGDILKETEFAVFRGALTSGGQVKAIRYPEGGKISRKEIDDLTALVRDFGAKGMAYFIVEEGGATKGPVAKFLSEAEIKSIISASEAVPGDLVAFVADAPDVVAKSLGRLR